MTSTKVGSQDFFYRKKIEKEQVVFNILAQRNVSQCCHHSFATINTFSFYITYKVFKLSIGVIVVVRGSLQGKMICLEGRRDRSVSPDPSHYYIMHTRIELWAVGNVYFDSEKPLRCALSTTIAWFSALSHEQNIQLFMNQLLKV